MLDSAKIIKDFPILARDINGKRLAYLDNAASSQKPLKVIEAISNFYKTNNANVHRGIHTLSEESSELYENARKTVSEFIGAARPKEVIFTSGTTDSINLVAEAWAVHNLSNEDKILITNAEHHSNLVPWQRVSKKTGAELKFIDYSDGEQDGYMARLKQEMVKGVKLVVTNHASNVTGAITQIKEVTKLAKTVGALVVVDGAQAAPHLKINVQSMDCDFYAFSGHKMLGPTGVGVLWARQELLEKMEPYRVGGGMIYRVSEQDATWAYIPDKFEAGTPNIAGAVGLAAAVDYLTEIGMDNVREHELHITKYAIKRLQEISGLRILGPQDPRNRTGVISFVIEGIHPHDLASILNTEGVAVRSGQHCAMPLHDKLGIPASTRASFYIYNNEADVDALIEGINNALQILK